MRDPFEKAIYRMASKRMQTPDDYIRVAKQAIADHEEGRVSDDFESCPIGTTEELKKLRERVAFLEEQVFWLKGLKEYYKEVALTGRATVGIVPAEAIDDR